MSDKTNIQFDVESSLYSKGKELVNDNRNKTSNSKDSKAFYGRRLFTLGIKKLQELQEEKKDKAVNYQEIDTKTSQLVEKADLNDIVS